MADPQEKQFELTTSAQVERTYRVRAKDADQAHDRVRLHLKDPESLREGLVTELADRQVDKTTQKVSTESIKELTPPRAVPDADAAPEGKKTRASSAS